MSNLVSGPSRDPKSSLHTAIQTVYRAIEQVKDCDAQRVAKLSELQEPLHLVMSEFGLDREEAWVFCMLLVNYVENRCDMEGMDMTKLFGADMFAVLRLQPTLQSLAGKGLLMSNQEMDNYDHSVLSVKFWPTVQAVHRIAFGDKLPEMLAHDEVNLLQQVHGLGQQLSKWRITEKQFYESFTRLCQAHAHMPVMSMMSTLNLPVEEKAALLFVMHAHLKGQGLGPDDLTSMVFGSIRSRTDFAFRMRGKTADIIRCNYVTICDHDPFDDVKVYLDVRGRELIGLISPAYMQPVGDKTSDSDELRVIRPEDIRAVNMMFNKEVEREYDRLTAMCEHDNFTKIKERLKGKGMRGGLTVLLSGGPGTGKTEMVRQLARTNGMLLLHVEMSAIKGMYTGQSERNIRSVFTQYARIAQREQRTPILLLNEADAIIGRRIPELGNANHASLQMLNTMQNILLQELEDFEGILMATTNMPSMFDPAFARRFRIKLEVVRPDQSVRQRLWAQKFPTFTTSELRQLAYHDLSGAEIDNIAIRMTHREILEGTEPTLSLALQLMHAETTVQHERVMGFRMTA
jgi:hypothetical protein